MGQAFGRDRDCKYLKDSGLELSMTLKFYHYKGH